MCARPRRASSGPASRGADALGAAAVDLEGGQLVRLESHRVVVAPLDLHLEETEQLEHRLDVRDPRDVPEHDLLARQE
jgi:hypothetical protein